MPAELQLLGAVALALAATLMATPIAIAIAGRIEFHDRPAGYKGHAEPTPYLGGAAVLVGFLVAALTLGSELGRMAPILGGAAALWLLGTLDDRAPLPAALRIMAEAAAGGVMWLAGLGWSVFGSDVVDLAASVLWVVGIVNAFNLSDNMDGAAGTLGAVSATVAAVLALVDGDIVLATLLAGLGGACLGFLPYNLARPSRIFLGDGGSLPIGFVIAAALMAMPSGDDIGWPFVLAALLLVGLPVVDTALVMVSRRRAGVPLLTGGRDHLTHRLSTRLGSAHAVAILLAPIQAVLGAIAIGVVELGEGSVIAAWSVWFVAATSAIVILETEAWAPVRSAAAQPRWGDSAPRRLPLDLVEGAAITFIVVACGASPFFYGFYDLSVWGPIALGLLATLLGLLLARPAAPRKPALVAAGALGVLWLWAVISTGWAESADQAMVDANRWLLYAALFGVLVLLLRNDRLAKVVVGAGAAAIAGLAAYVLARMLLGSGDDLFVGGRLHDPLGYVNGQAGYLLLGVWPLVALAERAERAPVGALAVAVAAGLVSVSLLGQTRAALVAFVATSVVLLVVVPGRARRAWVLTAIAGGTAVALGPVLDVYDGRSVTSTALRDAALAILLGALVAAAIWAGARKAGKALVDRFGLRRARPLALAPLAVIALAGLVLVLQADPAGRVAEEYRSFVGLERASTDSPRFTTGAGNRYDYWRIAWDQFAAHPVRGVGAGNYDGTYFAERSTAEDIRQPHSLELQVLGELGLVGGIALVVFIGAILFGFSGRAHSARTDRADRTLAVAAGGTLLMWLVHTSVDWLHLIPGVTGLALVSAAILVGPWRRPAAVSGKPLRGALAVTGALFVLLGAVLVGRAALAEKYESDARDLLQKRPSLAIAKANDSLALNDEALDTYYVRAAAFARLDDYARARATLLEATRREPSDFVPWGLLGDLAVRRGNLEQARAAYREAARLNPRDLGLAALARDPAGTAAP